jgi:hypothetical protein
LADGQDRAIAKIHYKAPPLGPHAQHRMGGHPMRSMDLKARQMRKLQQRIAKPHEHTRLGRFCVDMQVMIIRRNPQQITGHILIHPIQKWGA